MGDTFGQTTSQLGALRSILDSYPFSVGSLREQIQNADDAGASKQVCNLILSMTLLLTCIVACRRLSSTEEHIHQNHSIIPA